MSYDENDDIRDLPFPLSVLAHGAGRKAHLV